MLLEMIAIGGIAYYASRNFIELRVNLKPHSIARTIEKAKKTVNSATEQVKKQMVSEAEWRESKAREKAKAAYDATVANIFEAATEEEKETLLNLFKKYMPED